MKKLFLLLLIFSGCTSPIKKDVFTRKSLNYNDLMEINRSLSLELLHSFDTLSPKEFEMIYNTKQYADVDYLCGSLRKDSILLLLTVSEFGGGEYEVHTNSFVSGVFKGYNHLATYFIINDSLTQWFYTIFDKKLDTFRVKNIGYSDFTEYVYLLDKNGKFNVIDSLP